MAFWGVEVKPGDPFTLHPDQCFGRLRISQATLARGSTNNKSSSVQCNVGKKIPVLLCTLLPDKTESIHLELEFQEAEQVTFSVIGPRSVYLTGYVLGKTRQLLVGDDESESFGEDIGDTDTEVSKEVSDEDDYDGSFIDDDVPVSFPPSPSSSEQVRKSKKKANKRKRLKKKFELSESEDDGLTSVNIRNRKRVQIIESDEDDEKPISTLCGNTKVDFEASKGSCGKQDDVAGQPNNVYESNDEKVTETKLDNVAEQATDVAGQPNNNYESDHGKVMKTKLDNVAEQATDDCHADDGKVMTKKLDNDAGQTTVDSQSVDRKVKKKKKKPDDVVGQETENCQPGDKKGKRKKTTDDVAGQATDDCQSDDRKVKKKKRKNKTNELLVDTEMPSSVENEGTATDICTRTVFGGLVIKDLEIGEQDGKVASSGKKVTIHYTGRLKEQGQVFHSTVGKSPLKFRLGKDEALDGLHLGIDGMRVGGKRRLIIPPELGYGSDGTDGVPSNTWLVMDIELLKVR